MPVGGVFLCWRRRGSGRSSMLFLDGMFHVKHSASCFSSYVVSFRPQGRRQTIRRRFPLVHATVLPDRPHRVCGARQIIRGIQSPRPHPPSSCLLAGLRRPVRFARRGLNRCRTLRSAWSAHPYRPSFFSLASHPACPPRPAPPPLFFFAARPPRPPRAVPPRPHPANTRSSVPSPNPAPPRRPPSQPPTNPPEIALFPQPEIESGEFLKTNDKPFIWGNNNTREVNGINEIDSLFVCVKE